VSHGSNCKSFLINIVTRSPHPHSPLTPLTRFLPKQGRGDQGCGVCHGRRGRSGCVCVCFYKKYHFFGRRFVFAQCVARHAHQTFHLNFKNKSSKTHPIVIYITHKHPVTPTHISSPSFHTPSSHIGSQKHGCGFYHEWVERRGEFT
jgi:hypothetical protein